METKLGHPDKLMTLASISINDFEDLYRIVDLLNRTVKDRGLLFGLAIGNDGITSTIY
ncbi:MAG: DUF4264 family protein [Bacillota bacterium]